jgi:hypothetical protein
MLPKQVTTCAHTYVGSDGIPERVAIDFAEQAYSL